MSSGCGDVLSLEDLQTAKKHQLFEAEVITGKQGGVAGGADIDYATNSVTGQVQKTMPAILRDIGFEPASFDFTTGGTLGINDRNKAVLWPTASGGDGAYYAWQGVLPKTIPAGSTPASTGGVATGAWKLVADSVLRTNLASPDGAGLVGYTAANSYVSGTVGDSLNKTVPRKVLVAEGYGVVNSATSDSTAALQALIDANPESTIELPTNFAISAPIKFYTNTELRGRNSDQCVCNILPGFTGIAAFIPADTAKYAVIRPKITDMVIVDRGATADGKGTTSLIHGIYLLGTFGAQIRRITGVRVHSLVYCTPGDLGVHQYTARPLLEELDVSNCEYVVNFTPATDNRMPYGDIFASNIKTTGSMRHGFRTEDTDGLTMVNTVLFPDSQVRVSGGYINIDVCHPFEAKAKITDTGNSAESLLIPQRAGGDKTYYVNISGLASNFAGRLRDNTTGTGPVVNQGAFGIRIVNAQVVNLDATVNSPSQGGLILQNCSNVTFKLSTRNVNITTLGSGAYPAGTYDSVRLEGCVSVIGTVSDLSPTRNYTVYMDDSCSGCTVNGTTSAGATVGRFFRVPSNRTNFVTMNSEFGSGYRTVSTGEAEFNVITEATNTATPSPTYQSGQVVEFANTIVTSVTDIPSVIARQTVIVTLMNGNTTLVTENNGGQFVFTGTTTNQQGSGKTFRFYRDPVGGKLRQI